jgi:hypothetical protein
MNITAFERISFPRLKNLTLSLVRSFTHLHHSFNKIQHLPIRLSIASPTPLSLLAQLSRKYLATIPRDLSPELYPNVTKTFEPPASSYIRIGSQENCLNSNRCVGYLIGQLPQYRKNSALLDHFLLLVTREVSSSSCHALIS